MKQRKHDKKLGDIIDYNGHQLQAVKSEHYCAGCFFKEEYWCNKPEELGRCVGGRRLDKTDIRFIEL